jgi:uncharacterized protein Smg (DUF494 family)
VNDERSTARIRQVLALLASHLERCAEGDALALDALAAALQDPEFMADDLLAAAWVLRSLERIEWSGVPAAPGAAPGPQAQRVLSAEERESVGPEAWGYLLELRDRGALDAGQFERVLDLLAGSGVHPVSLAMAHEAAANVVLQLDPDTSGGIPYDDLDVAH